jgi:hypothetical protein
VGASRGVEEEANHRGEANHNSHKELQTNFWIVSIEILAPLFHFETKKPFSSVNEARVAPKVDYTQ